MWYRILQFVVFFPLLVSPCQTADLEIIMIKTLPSTAFSRLANRISRLILTVSLFLIAVSGPLWAGPKTEPPPQEASPPVPLEDKLSEVQVDTVPKSAFRRLPGKLNRLYAFDESPLDDRTPVVIIPGRAQEFQRNSWWYKFHQTTESHPTFNNTYKLYVYLYNSNAELQVQSAELMQGIRRHFGHLPAEQKIVLVSYSLGGNITRLAMEDKEVLQRTETVFGLAVPYHGSPVFNPEWFTRYIKPYSPIRKFWDLMLYRTYMSDKVNLMRHLHWNNFDGSLPQFEESAPATAQSILIEAFREKESVPAFKEKLIIYASYLDNPFLHEETEAQGPTGLPAVILSKTKAFNKKLVNSVLPYYGVSAHSALEYTNLLLGNLSTYTPQFPEGKQINLYRLNDGVIPMSSMLYLPASTTPYAGDLEELVRQADVRRVRVFKNIDHLDIGEYRGNRTRLIAPDELAPQDGERTPIEWVLFDLEQRTLPQPAPPPQEALPTLMEPSNV